VHSENSSISAPGRGRKECRDIFHSKEKRKHAGNLPKVWWPWSLLGGCKYAKYSCKYSMIYKSCHFFLSDSVNSRGTTEEVPNESQVYFQVNVRMEPGISGSHL
jgi:hypothetical protein